MKINWSDPVILGCASVLGVGLILFIWAIRALLRSGSTFVPAPRPASDELLPTPPERDFTAESISRAGRAAPAPAPVPAASPVSEEVADRLEAMSRRLMEMQTVLTKSAAQPGSAAAGGVGQGFSPETIDKLLKIIGNVIQQVDVLQRSLGNPGAPAGGNPAAPNPGGTPANP